MNLLVARRFSHREGTSRVVSGNRAPIEYGPRPSYRTVQEKAGGNLHGLGAFLTPQTIDFTPQTTKTPLFRVSRVVSGNRASIEYGPRPSYRTVQEKAGGNFSRFGRYKTRKSCSKRRKTENRATFSKKSMKKRFLTYFLQKVKKKSLSVDETRKSCSERRFFEKTSPEGQKLPPVLSCTVRYDGRGPYSIRRAFLPVASRAWEDLQN